MSFLAPLYLLGGLAVSVPLLLHLIRRTPKGRQVFSSLMFLSPSPPRITRRSRLEHWLLLALRAGLIMLLAVAFARPFLRESTHLLIDRGPGKRVAILLDTSASMRRGDLWRRAVEQVEATLTKLSADDLPALFPFDATLHSTLDFPDATVDGKTQRELLRARLRTLQPSWRETRLDLALTQVADALAANRRDRGGTGPVEIVVVSDMQQGSQLSGLQGYEWPQEVQVSLATVQATAARAAAVQAAAAGLGLGNAAPRLLPPGPDGELRARVASVASSPSEQFELAWSNGEVDLPGSQAVYVPPGETRVVKLAERPPEADRLRLRGDVLGPQSDFDNDYFVAPETQQMFLVHFLGSDEAADAKGLRYFLERVWPESARRKVTIADFNAEADWKIVPGGTPDLVIVADQLAAGRRPMLKSFLEEGGAAFAVAADAATGSWLTDFMPGIAEAKVGEPAEAATKSKPRGGDASFVLLTDLDFPHAIFAPFVDPRFADFTKVRFWKHARYSWPTASAAPRLLARFDDGSPAFWEQAVGKGKLLVLASTWRTTDSQLALSSKFVPLLSSILRYSAGVEGVDARSLVVGDPLPLDAAKTGPSTIVTPSGVAVELSAQEPTFRDTHEPGIYVWKRPQGTDAFAVNLAASESETDPLEPSQLEQLGVKIGTRPAPEIVADQQRQMRDLELESRQKLWQWLLVAALVLLGIETVVAGRTARSAALRMARESTP